MLKLSGRKYGDPQYIIDHFDVHDVIVNVTFFRRSSGFNTVSSWKWSQK